MTRRRGYKVRDHRHASRVAKCVDVSPAVCLQPIDHSSAPAGVVLNTPEADAYGMHPWGFIFGHEREGFPWRCEGGVSTDTCPTAGERPHWSMTGSLEGGDLTLSPSILCKAGSFERPADQSCGFHGFVQNGQWVPA